MNMVKVDVNKVREFLLRNGGFSDVDEMNLQEDAELIREECGCSVIQFHRQKEFDFKYTIPSAYVHADLSGRVETFSSGGGYWHTIKWHTIKWADNDHYYAVCNEFDGSLMFFDARADRQEGCAYDEVGFYEILREWSCEELASDESLSDKLAIFWELHDALVKELTELGYEIDYFDVHR